MPQRLRNPALPLLAVGLLGCLTFGATAQDPQAKEEGLQRPEWKRGDRWVVETVTTRLQGRREGQARPPKPIRWEFVVDDIEQLGDRECYVVQVTCLAKGRIRPKSTFWCDKETLFLRQYETQLAVAGKMRTIRESYDHGKGQAAPVVTPVSNLPIGMPAFLPPGSKINSFSYTSAPVAAGAKTKSLGLVTFANEVSQTTRPAGAKALKALPQGLAKSLERKPITEVNIETPAHKVTQLWQSGQPWPVFVDNGYTKAYLVKGN